MNIKRWLEEKTVGDWRVTVEYDEICGSPFWAVRISPLECGWICTVAERGHKSDAMRDFRRLKSEEVIAEIYKELNEERKRRVAELFGSHAKTIELAGEVLCGAGQGDEPACIKKEVGQ